MAEIILILKNELFFWGDSKYGKSNKVLLYWTEVCRESFGGWEVQTMWSFQKNMFCTRRSMF